MMGRRIFLKYWLLIKMLCFSFRFLPRFLKKTMWDYFSIFSGFISTLMKYLIFSSQVKNISKNTYIGKYVVIKNFDKIYAGDNLSIHDYCYLDAIGEIEIGNNVSIAHNCSLVSFNHSWKNINVPIKYNDVEVGKIKIGDDVWLGCGVKIMAGVTIGARSIVAAGAVVVDDIPTGVLVAGVPAKVVKIICT